MRVRAESASQLNKQYCVQNTLLSAGLCRVADIRRHFDKVLWVTVVQEPNIMHLQELLYLQCTGSEPPAGSTVEKLKETLRQKLAAARVLLVVDDC
jgi:hypothetical protein